MRSFEELALDAGDLVAARSLARSGRLGAIVVLEAMASAVVDPGSDQPLMARSRSSGSTPAAGPPSPARPPARAGYAAALEVGDLPADLVEHADEAGVEVLPGPGDIDTACECDAWAQPCVHALALLYQLAWHVDRDPYVLLLLRGRTREALLAEVDALAAGRPTHRRRPSASDARVRAAQVLALAEDAPAGHGLADAGVAAYDEAVTPPALSESGSPRPDARRTRRAPCWAISAQQARASPRRSRKALCGVEFSSPKVAWTLGARLLASQLRRIDAELLDPDLDVLALGLAHLLPRLQRQRRPVPVLHHDQRLVVQREGDVPVDQRPQGLLGSRRRRDPARPTVEQLVADADQHLGEHRVLGAEVPVERRPGEPAGGAELGDGDAVEALLREQLGRDGQDLLPALGHAPEVSGR